VEAAAQGVRAGPVAEAQGIRPRPALRWYDVPGRTALVRGARNRREGTQDQAYSGYRDMRRKEPQFAICVKNKEYRASLELRKLYQVVPDDNAARHRQLRVIDESGEDYLYPENYFVPVELPQSAEKAVLRAAGLISAKLSQLRA